ncbi:hypothetical protein PSRA_1158 [Pseudoscardovia radai]|uniref:Uncharacterized protein n=1 Tax=Pseudoscardovia radai TaxID=987066 RepID=A0A261EXE7_9BIFI|nr:hypothetical protein [Pseudoscardovia radai]OZG51523.1 hypothetical protein PSRA_1158 [Pseudoscardovia radai]
MICSHCDNAVPEGMGTCPYCGNSLVPTDPATGMPTGMPVNATVQPTPTPQGAAKKKHHANPRIIIAIVAFVLAIALAATGVMLRQRYASAAASTTQTQAADPVGVWTVSSASSGDTTFEPGSSTELQFLSSTAKNLGYADADGALIPMFESLTIEIRPDNSCVVYDSLVTGGNGINQWSCSWQQDGGNIAVEYKQTGNAAQDYKLTLAFSDGKLTFDGASNADFIQQVDANGIFPLQNLANGGALAGASITFEREGRSAQ